MSQRNHRVHPETSAPDGPRERLRAWRTGDPALPQHTLDNLLELERKRQLQPSDEALLKAYEAYQSHPPAPVPLPQPPPPPPPPPAPPGDLGALLGQLEAYVAAAYASKASKRADPVSLAAMMRPDGGLRPGDVVVLAPGVYGGTYVLSQKVDGTAGAPIVFVGTPDCKVTGVIAVDNEFTVAHGLMPSGSGRVRCGGFAVQVSFDQK